MKAIILVLFSCLSLFGKEARDRDWLVRYLTQPIASTPRSADYLRLINRELDDTYLGLNLDFLENGGADLSREQTNTIGALAFCYRTPGLKFYRDAALLEKLRVAYLAVARHIDEKGFTKWQGDRDYFYEPHEQAWRLEPLLAGYVWVGEHFPEKDRRTIEAALGRAGQWLYENPIIQTNNRGAVWCAVLTMAGLYFEKPEYLSKVESEADAIMNGVVLDDGEVGEHTRQYGGGGPDANYSYTGFSYVYLYRVMSGKNEMDAKLERAMRWFSAYNTISGFPVATGASVRRHYVDPERQQDILPGLERFSHRDPFFATIASHLLAKREKYKTEFRGHIISPLIWALWERGVAAPTGTPPSWYTNYTALYNRPQVEYTLVSRNYQTGVVSRGRLSEGYYSPLRGVQTFAYGGEYPIILNTDDSGSTMVAGGIDTARENTDETLLQEHERLAVLVERRKNLWSVYAFTPDSAVVIHGGVAGPYRTVWAMNRAFVPEPHWNESGRYVKAKGCTARLYPGKGTVRFDAAAGHLEVLSESPVSISAFSNDKFQFQESDPRELRFSDGSGSYRVDLEGVLNAEGSIDRSAPMRLHREP